MKSEYLKRKEERKKIWLEKVFANTAGADEKKLLKEALIKFEKEYPKE
jgi:hypothetical protein